ncbi:MAG TPA: Zn-ribbon domain-containing OB-fold protein [Acidimicrobiia bacterium]
MSAEEQVKVDDPWAESPKWLIPSPDADDREFWEGAARGELRIQHCNDCGLYQHYARILCSHCGSWNVEWVTASGGGTLHTFTVIRQNGVPPFPDRVPFVVALVELDEPGARVLAAMPATPPDTASIGMRVQATFRPAGNDLGFVDFEVAS